MEPFSSGVWWTHFPSQGSEFMKAGSLFMTTSRKGTIVHQIVLSVSIPTAQNTPGMGSFKSRR